MLENPTIEVGRRYTRRQRSRYENEWGFSENVSIDAEAVSAVGRRRLQAAFALRAAGYDVDYLVAMDPGAKVLLEQVLNGNGPDDPGAEPDSPVGLAALIHYHCCQLQQWLQHGGPQSSWIVEHAFALGHLVTLSKVYGIDAASLSERQRRASAARRKYTPADRAEWRALRHGEFAHIKSNAEAARRIVRRLGLPAKATHTIRKAF